MAAGRTWVSCQLVRLDYSYLVQYSPTELRYLDLDLPVKESWTIEYACLGRVSHLSSEACMSYLLCKQSK